MYYKSGIYNAEKNRDLINFRHFIYFDWSILEKL